MSQSAGRTWRIKSGVENVVMRKIDNNAVVIFFLVLIVMGCRSNFKPSKNVELEDLENLLWSSFDDVYNSLHSMPKIHGLTRINITRTSKIIQRLHSQDAAHMCDLTSALSGLANAGIGLEEAERTCNTAFRYLLQYLLAFCPCPIQPMACLLLKSGTTCCFHSSPTNLFR